MSGANRRIFVSHSHADNALCEPLLAALDAWGLDYWFDTQELNPGQQLSDRLQQALDERDVFVRICTRDCQRSYWTAQELLAFRGLQQRDAGHGRQRKLIFLLLDQHYVLEPVAQGDVVINAVTRPQAVWMKDLRGALGVAAIARSVNRRAFLGLGVAGLATIASAGTAAVVLFRAHGAAQAAPLIPTTHAPTATPLANAQRLLWSEKLTDGNTADTTGPTVTVSGGAVYANSEIGVYALRASDGSILWHNGKAQLPAGSMSAPLLAGEKVYVLAPGGLANTGLFCLSAADGSQVWVTNVSFLDGSALALSGSTIYLSGADGNAYAFDAASGNRLWQTQIGSAESGKSSPAVADGRVFVGADDGAMHALDARTGSPVWTRQTGSGQTAQIESSPAVSAGVVYFGSDDGNCYAVSAADGALRWRQPLKDASGYAGPVTMSPVLQNGTVYIGNSDGLFVALDASSGAVRWQQTLAIAPGSQSTIQPYGRAAINGNTLYVSASDGLNSHFLLALSARDGTELWRFATPPTGQGTPTAPILAGNVAYFGGADAAVYAVSIASA